MMSFENLISLKKFMTTCSCFLGHTLQNGCKGRQLRRPISIQRLISCVDYQFLLFFVSIKILITIDHQMVRRKRQRPQAASPQLSATVESQVIYFGPRSRSQDKLLLQRNSLIMSSKQHPQRSAAAIASLRAVFTRPGFKGAITLPERHKSF